MERLVSNYILAESQFKHVIQMPDEDNGIFKKTAAEQLLALSPLLNEPYSELQSYYLNEPGLHTSEKMSRLADYLSNCCEIKMGDYQEAITWFESIIDNPPSEIDSMYAVIDLAYTYILMEDDNNAKGYIGKYPQYRFARYQDYDNLRESLLKNIFSTYPDAPAIPVVYHTTLSNNYPNPFNPTTTIRFSLEKDGKSSLIVYNIRGQKVKTLVDGFTDKGLHSVIWNGKNDDGKSVSSGIYFYRLHTANQNYTKKMVLLK